MNASESKIMKDNLISIMENMGWRFDHTKSWFYRGGSTCISKNSPNGYHPQRDVITFEYLTQYGFIKTMRAYWLLSDNNKPLAFAKRICIGWRPEPEYCFYIL